MKINTAKKQDIDWGSLGFSYLKTDARFSANYQNGTWNNGKMVVSENVTIHEGSTALHYAQQCFEGMKAQTAPDGRVLLFRPELNLKRMNETASRLLMPELPEELFLHGVMEAVRHNYSWIPPHGSGASLYIRPLLIGVGANLGLKAAPQYEFRVFVCPVGPYYKSEGLSVISLAVTDIDRAAPKGIGHVKAGSNYAGGLLATQEAQRMGASEALYLDAAERTYLEEAGSANIVLKMKHNRFVTPKSSTILPSITKKSILEIARKELKLKTEERAVNFLAELPEIEEMAACGTATVLSPVGKVWINNGWVKFYGDGEKVGPTTQKLYDLLISLQRGEREDPYNWTKEVKLS